MVPNRRLKQARELRGWSQAKVAEQIGTDATTVSRWERGLFSPTPYFRERLCVLFGKNAEELGLLDSESRLEEVQRESFSRPATTRVYQQEAEAQPASSSSTSTIAPPPAPSWPRRGDTFAFILDSAAHDYQAHALWEDAYVRSLRGQRTEARQLGEASLNAFEHVGHPNAEAIREWLKRNELVPPSPPATPPTTTTPLSSVPRPLERKTPKRALKQLLTKRNMGLAILLLVVTAMGITSLVLNQSATPRVQAGVPTLNAATSSVTQSAAGQSTSTPAPIATGNQTSSNALPTPTREPSGSKHETPTSKPTTPPTAVPPMATSPATTPTGQPVSISITPASLSPANCEKDSGYRCTLYVTLATNQSNQINWQLNSTNPQVTCNPASGTNEPNKTFEIIVYLPNVAGQTIQLVLTATVASQMYQQQVTWQN